MKQIAQIYNKKLSRKEFLTFVFFGVLSLTGVFNLIKNTKELESRFLSPKTNNSNGFGGGAYGKG
jgi:hypothetical protein